MSAASKEALEKFKTLEERVGRILEALQQTRRKKGAAENELANARRQIELLEKDLDGLRKERGVVRDRVKNLIESIAKLSEKQIV
jgi:chromosome segregation ATPase